jgi:eukaryotic-like serine/threonine-protein kinase
MLGERFGSFKAVAKIGEGSVGEVFLAEHQRLARRAAIKVLTPQRTQDEVTVRRLFVEARATSLIRHPGIVEVYDCDVHRNGRAYIVMEYLQGENLSQRLHRVRVLPWQTACRIGRQVADAIGAAHDQGIIHRDLKPANVFLLSAADWPAPADVKVLDFGLAKLMAGNPSDPSVTAEGSIIGSPAFMSPEQCSGAPADHRCDVYSLGCLLFETVAGRWPFTGNSVRELLAAHRFKAPPSLSALAPQAPSWLSALVARMLRKDPGERPQSMAEVIAVLDGAEAPRPARAVAGDPFGRCAADPA